MSKLRRDRALGFIDTVEDLKRGIRALRRSCADLRRAHELAGDPPLRRHPPGLEGLSRIVVGQQLSIASAEAIWTRTRTAVQPFTAERLLSIKVDRLQACGLSRPKIRTLRSLAACVASGEIAVERLATAEETEVHAALTSVPGIGPWTADIFLLFCAGRADAWAAGDLALQVAVQMMLDLDQRPSARELAEIAERWRPYRGVAARILWAYYAAAKAQRLDAPI